MDSYVNSLGNFAAGVGAEALAGATGQAAARRGRAGPGGTGRVAQVAGTPAVLSKQPLAPRRATSAPGPPQTREGRSLETRTRKPEARAALHLPPSPTPSSESLLLPGPSPAKPDADGGGAVALGVQREPVESRPRPRDAPAPPGRDPGERGLGSGRPGSPDEREEGVTATASAGRRGPQEPWLAPRLSRAGAEARQMPGI